MAGFEFSQEPQDLSQAVHEAGGAFSVCWESMEGTGVFQDARAREVADAVIAWVNTNYMPKGEFTVELAGQQFTQAQWEAVQNYAGGNPRKSTVRKFATLDELRTDAERAPRIDPGRC